MPGYSKYRGKYRTYIRKLAFLSVQIVRAMQYHLPQLDNFFLKHMKVSCPMIVCQNSPIMLFPIENTAAAVLQYLVM